MADSTIQGNGGKKTQLSSIKTNASSVFTRSMTAFAPMALAVAGEEKTASHLQRNGSIKALHGPVGNSLNGNVKKLCTVFESPRHSFEMEDSPPLSPMDSPVRLPGTEDRVVIYFTSLRGIRRTFQDCHRVRMIFRGFRANVDERDVSMDAEYLKEMEELFGEKTSLPQVFIKGKHIGGAESVINLLEGGDLVRMLKGIPLRSLKPCDVCDDVRFLACVNCGGSRKVFDEDKEQVNRCPICNENGLMRCPLCSS